MKMKKNIREHSIFTDTNGFIYCQGKNVLSKYNHKRKKYGTIINNSIDKFGHNVDCDESLSFFFNGYVSNINEFVGDSNLWYEQLISLSNKQNFPNQLRGGFCGFIAYDRNHIKLFVDHTGNRSMFYYQQNNLLFVSNRMDAIVRCLREITDIIEFDINGIESFFEFGFLNSYHTLVKHISRVEPGTTVEIDLEQNKCVAKHYFLINNNEEVINFDKKQCIEKIEYLFTNSIRRSFNLDKNNGYTSVVELSGGLDSRMVTMVADELGFKKQTNISTCTGQHLDRFISQAVAQSMSHRFIENIIDDLDWIDDCFENVYLNNWTCSFLYTSPMHRILDQLRNEGIGILHTGILGDAVLSTLYPNRIINYSMPTGDENAYTNKVKYPLSINPLFNNREKMSIHVTGFLGLQAPYLICQNFFECNSPFLDVDLLKYVYTIPFEYRMEHRLYIDWIEQMHPQATEFGWEKWGGLQPLNCNRTIWNNNRMQYKPHNIFDQISSALNDRMEIFESILSFDKALLSDSLIEDAYTLLVGGVHEKCMVISALISIYQIKQIFDGRDDAIKIKKRE